MKNKVYRQGAVGAMLDEYEKAVDELKVVISTLDLRDYTAIADKETKDMNCVSIQSILNHVVRSGYGYANYIRRQYGDEWVERKENYELHTPAIACSNLDDMMKYTEQTLMAHADIDFDEMIKNVFMSQWGQQYDFEQIIEHAIVHILRHRRQIERFKLKLKQP